MAGLQGHASQVSGILSQISTIVIFYKYDKIFTTDLYGVLQWLAIGSPCKCPYTVSPAHIKFLSTT